MRSRFDEELSRLSSDLTTMGALCEETILTAVEDLSKGNTDAHQHIAPFVEEIAGKEKAIESQCLKLLLQQQPVASDLRQISAALKMITDMDRIGVQASEIAEIIGFLDGRTGSECEYIRQEAMETIKMVNGAVDAYVKHDVDLANKIIDMDDIVDDLFCKVKAFLIEMITSNPDDGGYALDLLMISKYFEKIGDHAVNIAEWVIFSETGVHKGGA
mgnify:FL=1|jgi:phosphate transport system protein